MLRLLVLVTTATMATLVAPSFAANQPAMDPPPESRDVWTDRPAQLLTEATPLGNGRLGACVYGGVESERILLNESGLWSGSPQAADRPDAAASLPEIRRLLLAGRNAAAEALVSKYFTCAGAGSARGAGANSPYGSYQLLGNLELSFSQADSAAPVEHYRRELDLAKAICRVSYERAGVHYLREAFVSAPAEAVVIRFSASTPGQLSFDAKLTRPERGSTEAVGSDGLALFGQLNDGHNGTTGVRFAARVRAVAHGGTVATSGNTLGVRGADEVLLFVTAATDIKTFAGRHVADARAAADADLAKASARSFSELRREHIADYRRYFDRVSLRLGAPDAAAAARPTPDRLKAFAAGRADPSLAALYFNFGRYLLISSSRPGGLPPNLQGLWADTVQTPWNGDWHANINIQMNYWPAEVCNLSELTDPLFALIQSLPGPGAKTAQAYYRARGWVAFLLLNPWGFTSPGESASWGSTVSCSAWLCQHLWDHYLFTGDRTFLREVYPTLKGASLFYLDMLIEEPSHHWLVTAPSNSPENAYYLPDGKVAHVCLGPTIDMQLLRYLFDATANAAQVLGVDPALQSELEAKRTRLAPTRIGADGRILEWLEEYREVDPHHRHVSHLWGLYPGNEISATVTPALAIAARKSLDARGDEGTGWSLAWKMALWARLGDGERAHTLLRQHLSPAAKESTSGRWTGGTYPNLFDAHPPFQIDGNFGGTAAIAEMVLQSSPDEITLLPALPSAWSEGEAHGLCARGGYQVDLSWQDGRLVSATVRSVGGTRTKVRSGNAETEITLRAGEAKVLSPAEFRRRS